jgi:nucleoid DNA-binding protein
MSRIINVAKEVGLHPVTCSHCGKATDTDNALDAFFRAILEHVRVGEEVHVKNFGVFRQQILKGRKLNTPLVDVEEFGDSIVIRFKQSANAKQVLNRQDEPAPAKTKAKKGKAQK